MSLPPGRTHPRAQSGEWRGDTMRLTYGEGSFDDVKAAINCNAMSGLINDDDGLVLIYPDGELDCRAEQ